ncbi:hypothetical protein [Chondrinema litorale]|uniref:hypothetical protein n=1 Tax=Chondrinema litorale TaxID=2994555 RepID=UPI0025430F4E|nr:hypothetical protein [Chondrinema litorale]UZR94125.1 hypothetical protein OQ292_19980 [Chondrinema litorale]
MSKKRQNIFYNEQHLFERSREVNNAFQESTDKDLLGEYDSLSSNYGRLLGEVKLITSVSDRLQNKLNKANEKISEQNEKLTDTVNLLTKAKISRAATTIVLIIAVFLFMLSEGVLEPIVEGYVDNDIIGFALKAVIAILLKPIEMLIESILYKKARKKAHHSINLNEK